MKTEPFNEGQMNDKNFNNLKQNDPFIFNSHQNQIPSPAFTINNERTLLPSINKNNNQIILPKLNNSLKNTLLEPLQNNQQNASVSNANIRINTVGPRFCDPLIYEFSLL